MASFLCLGTSQCQASFFSVDGTLLNMEEMELCTQFELRLLHVSIIMSQWCGYKLLFSWQYPSGYSYPLCSAQNIRYIICPIVNCNLPSQVHCSVWLRVISDNIKPLSERMIFHLDQWNFIQNIMVIIQENALKICSKGMFGNFVQNHITLFVTHGFLRSWLFHLSIISAIPNIMLIDALHFINNLSCQWYPRPNL